VKKAAEHQAAGGRKAVVDELAALEKYLEAEYADLAIRSERAELLRATILLWYDKADASTSYVAEGEKDAYTVSARALKTTVHYASVIKHLGAAKFRAIATVTLDKLKKAAGGKYKLCVSSSRTGGRTLTRVASSQEPEARSAK